VNTRPDPRWYPPLFVGLLVLLLLANVVAPPSLRLPAAASARVEPAPLRTIPDTDVNPYGANFFLQYEAEPWKVDKTLQMAREAGLGWVKQHFPWEDIELRKGKFWNDQLNKSTWEKYDRIVDTSRKHGLEIIARLDRPPAWARHDNSIPEAPPDSFEDYGDFVAAVVEHYKGQIRYYQLWNEPNIYPEWGNRAVDPLAYTRLLQIGYQRAKAVDPNVRILSAPLAQTLEPGGRNMSELVYLETMYRAGARDWFDILFANGYGFDRSPDDPPDPGVLNFQRVQLVRQIMERYGDAAKPVWFNEFGWNAAPESFPAERLLWKRVSESQQADYVVQAIQRARATWDWAGVFCVWYFRQAGQIPPERADYYFRMVDVGFTPRPVYNLVKKATESIGVAGPGSFQETNPAVSYQGDWASVLIPEASGGMMRVARTPGDGATIAFHGNEIHLLTRRGPDAPTVYVTLDGRETNRLPRDRQGRSYVDLYSTTPQPRALVAIAEALPSRDHVLRITMGPSNPAARESALALDGFEVYESEDGWPFGLPWVAPWAGVAAVGIAASGLLWWRRRRAPS
jgi:polysaccharide biosynthesis protein PslG